MLVVVVEEGDKGFGAAGDAFLPLNVVESGNRNSCTFSAAFSHAVSPKSDSALEGKLARIASRQFLRSTCMSCTEGGATLSSLESENIYKCKSFIHPESLFGSVNERKCRSSIRKWEAPRNALINDRVIEKI
ncbi:hypothetical protein PsorP6_001376 [Peronosclerospora sorghi]|uniref:Uncharacterized protein n=1 Tax=Peronosclerospora sorghi TaxID=230839 RepID=A0ACC0WXZ8_9STRA|nr:hypothetical protein PsorP6_001376 [Peronosclerospora sorghi]